MNIADPAWAWGIAIIAFAFGIVIGIAISYLLLTQDKRAGKLQEQLDATKAEFNDYRTEVNQHFTTTSELFQSMTLQYKAVYEHLSRGAQNLCGDEVDAPRLDIPEKRVLPTQGSEDAQSRQAADERIAEADVDADETEYDADAKAGRDHERQTA